MITREIREKMEFFSMKNVPTPFKSELNDFLKFHHRKKAWLEYREEFKRELRIKGIEWDGYTY